MAKYHINAKGVPSVCRASKKPCPFGGSDGTQNHFSSKEEAQAFADKQNQEEFGTPGLQTEAQLLSNLSPREREQKEYEQFLEKEFAPAVQDLISASKTGPMEELHHGHNIPFDYSDMEDLIENPELYHRSISMELRIESEEYGEDFNEGMEFSVEEKIQAAEDFDDAAFDAATRLSHLDKKFMDKTKLAQVYDKMSQGGVTDYSQFKLREDENKSLSERLKDLPTPEARKDAVYQNFAKEEFAPAIKELSDHMNSAPMQELRRDHSIGFSEEDFEILSSRAAAGIPYGRGFEQEVREDFNYFKVKDDEGNHSVQDKLEAARKMDEIVNKTYSNMQIVQQKGRDYVEASDINPSANLGERQKIDMEIRSTLRNPERLAEMFDEHYSNEGNLDYSKLKF